MVSPQSHRSFLLFRSARHGADFQFCNQTKREALARTVKNLRREAHDGMATLARLTAKIWLFSCFFPFVLVSYVGLLPEGVEGLRQGALGLSALQLMRLV